MTLRKATILITCLGVLGLLAAVAVATHLTIDAGFDDLERRQALLDLERVRNALGDEVAKLDDVVVDWAMWDDSQRFMQGRAKDYAASTLNDRTLASLKLAAIAYVARDGRLVWAQGCDPQSGLRKPLPEGLAERLVPGSALLKPEVSEDRVKGLVLLPQGPMLLASCPITDSEGHEPSTGVLVMLRSLSPRDAAVIAERMRLPLSLARADSPPGPELSPLVQALTGGMAVGPVSDSLFGAVLILPDIWGVPAVRAELREAREINGIGDAALQRAHVWSVCAALFLLGGLLFLLRQTVLRRLGRLAEQVLAIGAQAAAPVHDGPLGRVEMPGRDEFSQLAASINSALNELDRSRGTLSTQYAMIQEQESYLQQILDSIQAGVLLVDPQTHLIREVNAFAAARVGRRREDIVGRMCHGFICPNELGQCPVTDLGGGGEQKVRSLLTADGASLPVLKSVSCIERDGKPFLLETFIDVEELQKAQEALKRSEETYRAVFMNTGSATMLIEADTTIILANQEFEKITGYSKKELEGRMSWMEFFAPEDVERMLQHHVRRRQAPGLAPRNYEARLVNRRDETRTVLLTVGMIPASGISVASIEDITERKQSEEMLRHQAFHDSLTGLPNRLLLQDRLERAVESARREEGQLAVLLMDLDRFKDINDSMGHGAGDKLLREVAVRLGGVVRRSDTVARLGGDEFVLMVDAPAGEAAAAMVAQHVLDCFALPFDIDDRSLHMRLSMGIALFPDHGDSPEELLKNADLAMYRAKGRGRNTFAFYTKELNDEVTRRLAVEMSLRRAMGSGGVEVFYQPKVELPGKRLAGAEALVRLRREDGGLTPPSEFIPVAENTGLIEPLGELVLRTACAQAAKWRAGGHPDFVLAVNLSPRQFQRPDLAAHVRAILEETGLPPEALELEITENLLMDISPETLEALSALTDMGAAMVLDDFGKEYSSLGYIKKLPIQTIKIDRSFIDGLPGDEDDAAIVRSVLSMAASLQLRVVAEGVETSAQLDFLEALGCTEFQGYYFSPPVERLDMDALLEQADPFAVRPES